MTARRAAWWLLTRAAITMTAAVALWALAATIAGLAGQS